MPGCKEVARLGWNGWLVPPRDKRSIAGAVEDALKQTSEEREIMGRRSESLIRKYFSLEQVATAYAGIYREALERLG